jgi:hypothetical protein
MATTPNPTMRPPAVTEKPSMAMKCIAQIPVAPMAAAATPSHHAR